MEKANTDALKQFGLDNKEIGLYIAGLTAGEALGMSELAKKAGIKRSTAYIIYKSLEIKGLMGSIETPTGKKFSAKDPHIFLQKADVIRNKALEIIPQLELLSNQGHEKPEITYYEGKESYLLFMEDSLKKPNITIRHIGSIESIHNVVDVKYDRDFYVPNRVKQNIFLKALYFESKQLEMDMTSNKKLLRKVKHLPNAYKYNTSTLIYEDTVIISTDESNPLTIMIKSKDIAHAEKQKFDLIWDLMG